MPEEPFSQRRGYHRPSTEIRFREEAPDVLRQHVLRLTYRYGLPAPKLRDIVCDLLQTFPDPDNWEEEGIFQEVAGYFKKMDWFHVYDIIEIVYGKILRFETTPYFSPEEPISYHASFENEINKVFLKLGAGWKLEDGRLKIRGDDTFESTVQTTKQTLKQSSLSTTQGELYEAIRDLSRRPDPDLSGAIQHPLCALESIARVAANDQVPTLGKLLKLHPSLFPSELKSILENYGYMQTTLHVTGAKEILLVMKTLNLSFLFLVPP